MTHEQIEYRNYVLQGMASYGGDVAQALVWQSLYQAEQQPTEYD